MASIAHCLYCFESLSATLEHRSPLSLAEIEELWERYKLEGTGWPDEDDHEDEDDDNQESDEDETTGASANHVENKRPRYLSTTNSTSRQPSGPSTASSSTPSLQSTASSIQTSSSSASTLSSISSASSGAPQQPQKPPPPSQTATHPMFVTWNTTSRSGHPTLRGCIGTFEPVQLEHGLHTYALTAALEDTRFPPIALRELSSLSCGVTLLTDFEPAPTPLSWEVGKHGLRISFTHKGKRYGATYLPDVAREQGWGKEEALGSLMRKAGWRGREGWREVELKVVRYQGKRREVGYERWREWRRWVGERGGG